MAAHKTEDDFEAEHDLRSLVEAEKIKGDAKRLKRAMAKARDQMTALKKVEKA